MAPVIALAALTAQILPLGNQKAADGLPSLRLFLF
jgi:hypothetical protein